MKFLSTIKEIKGYKIPCKVCETDNDELYHHTDQISFQQIAKDKVLRPRCDDEKCAGTVSFSANPRSTFSGDIRLVMDRKKTEVSPMCYYNHTAVSNAGVSIDKLERETADYLGFLNLDLIRGHLGIQPDCYDEECEWFSRDPVPLEGAIKKVVFMIPWKVNKPYPRPHISCKRSHPHYSFTENSWGYDLDNLIEDIQKIKELTKSLDAEFEVDSCFPFFKEGSFSPKFVELHPKNLEKMAKGIKPAYSSPPSEFNEEMCKC